MIGGAGVKCDTSRHILALWLVQLLVIHTIGRGVVINNLYLYWYLLYRINCNGCGCIWKLILKMKTWWAGRVCEECRITILCTLFKMSILAGASSKFACGETLDIRCSEPRLWIMHQHQHQPAGRHRPEKIYQPLTHSCATKNLHVPMFLCNYYFLIPYSTLLRNWRCVALFFPPNNSI